MSFEDDLLGLERRVLEEAGGDFFRAVADLRRMLAADTAGVARRLEELALPALEEAAQQGTLDGWSLGGRRAVTAAETARLVDPNMLGDADLRLLTPPTHLTDPFTGLDALLADAKIRSLALLRSGADEAAAAAPVFQAATTARARIITQVNAASNLAAVEVGDATRSPMVWEAERDACVYCLALAGEVVERAGDPFPSPDLYAQPPSSMTTTSTPPLHPHCLPGDATVTPGSRVTGASSRIYKGEMVRVRTLSGKELSATPNHPVLTDRGWVALGLLRVGDRVVSRIDGEGPLTGYDDCERMPASISEIAEAVLGSSEVTATEVPMSAVDFHGDGTEGEVAHIAADLHLEAEDVPLCGQHRREALLMLAVDRATGGPASGHAGNLLVGLSGSSDGGVGGFGEAGAFLWGRVRHALEHGGGPVAWFDAALEQAEADGGTADPEAASDALLALAGEVIADELVSVERYPFHGPVFNVETETGWYTGNGIVVHNCRCRLAILVAQSYADALKREAQRSILRGHSLASESQAVRVRAAARLLERDPVAPKTVKAFAAAAVKRGHFPTRDVPAGDPRLIITRGGSSARPSAPPPSPTSEPPAPSVKPSLRDELAALKKPAEMQAAAQARHPDIKWEGFDMRGAKPDFARDVLGTVSEMLDAFPGMKLTHVTAKLLPGRRVVAQAKAYISEFGSGRDVYETPRIEVNSRFLKDPTSLAEGVAKSNESGHFHAIDPGQEVRHLVTHEFAHAIDYMTQKKLTAAYEQEIAKANPYTKGTAAEREWRAANVSGYGQSSHEEGVAEAISDALLKGNDALPFSRHFFEIAKRIYREEVPGAAG